MTELPTNTGYMQRKEDKKVRKTELQEFFPHMRNKMATLA